MKNQIALEYIIIYSLVLIIFIFLFSVLSFEHLVVSSSEIYSELSSLAQSIAMNINFVYAQGSGFSERFALPVIFGLSSYNITISPQGIVVVSASIGNEKFQSVSYSIAKNIISNPIYKINNLYNIPVAFGYLNISNMNGAICIDYNCSSNLSYISNFNLSLFSQQFYAASFSQVPPGYIQNTTSNKALNYITVVFWFYPIDNGLWGSPNNYWENAISGGSGCWNNFYFYIESGVNPPTESWGITNTNGQQYRLFPGVPLAQNTWQQLVGVYNGSALTIYLNGKPIGSTPASGQIYFNGFTISGTNPITSSGGCNPISGYLANVQIYSIPLTGNQINALYNEGINGAPLSNLNKYLLTWVPLNGNANDYSGNNYTIKTYGSVQFYSVNKILAKVIGSNGKPISNALVGFVANIGLFNNSKVYTASTNQSGIATAYLSFNKTEGTAHVLVTAYPMNANSISLFYPLNLGYGNTVYDLSFAHANGNAFDTNWLNSLVTKLYNSSINVTTSINSPFSLNIWFNASKVSNNTLSCSNVNDQLISLNVSNTPLYISFNSSAIMLKYSTLCSLYSTKIFSDNWYDFGIVSSTSGTSIFLDGILINQSSHVISSVNSIIVGGMNYYGSFGNLQLYSSALSNEQMYTLYLEGPYGLPFSSITTWIPLSQNISNGYYNGLWSLNSSRYLNLINLNNVNNFVSSFNGIKGNITLFNRNVTPSGWTEAAWVYINGSSTGWCGSGHSNVILTDRGPGSGYSLTLGTSPASNNYFGFFFGWDSNSISEFATSLDSFTYKNWYFVVGVYNSSYGFRLYVNGIPVAYYTNSGSHGPGPTCSSGTLISSFNSTYPWVIGYEQAWANVFNGSIANIQIYSRPLSSKEIYSLYKEGINGIPLSNGLVAWYPLNGNANDYSNKKLNGINYGATFTRYNQISNLTYMFKNGLLFSYGANGNSYVAANGYLPLSGGFGASAWFIAKPTYGDTPNIISYGPGSTSGGFQIGIEPNGDLYCGISYSNSWQYFVTNYKIQPYTLYNVICSASPTNGVVIYVNGMPVYTNSYTGSIEATPSFICLGTWACSSQYFNGLISNVMVFNKFINESLANAIYHTYPKYSIINVPLGVYP